MTVPSAKSFMTVPRARSRVIDDCDGSKEPFREIVSFLDDLMEFARTRPDADEAHKERSRRHADESDGANADR